MVGLEKYEGAPVEAIRSAAREALKKLVDTALRERVNFILLSGDIYDGDWRDVSTGMFFIQQMVRLNQAHIPVYIIKGNHDAAAQISNRLPMPNNVFEFAGNQPQTFLIHELKVAIHGQSFAVRAVKDNLALNYPPSEPGFFNIGMLHTSINGREGHDHYAPCSVQDLIDKGYDYWALGHVHKQEMVCSGNPCWIVFPGNTQGRSIKEKGEKGCILVTVQKGRVESVQQVQLDSMRWDIIEVDVSGMKQAEEIYERIAETLDQLVGASYMPFALRMMITGRCLAHYQFMAQADEWKERIRAAILDNDADLWLEKIKFQTRPENEEEVLASPALEAVHEVVNQYIQGDEGQEELLTDINKLLKTLPAGSLAEMHVGPENIHSILAEVEDFLAGLLTGGEQHEN